MSVVFAAALYNVFCVGRIVSTALFPFAAGQIENIYATRSQASPAMIATALITWNGPSEEVFWRGGVKPVIGAVLPLSEGGRGHEMLEKSAVLGKIVLAVPYPFVSPHGCA
jgi:NADPH:quinone reductase-like Zn-dependent oxidoreductase